MPTAFGTALTAPVTSVKGAANGLPHLGILWRWVRCIGNVPPVAHGQAVPSSKHRGMYGGAGVMEKTLLDEVTLSRASQDQ